MSVKLRYPPSADDLAAMRAMWSDPTVPIEAIQRRMRTSLHRLRALAAEIGLPVRAPLKKTPPRRAARTASASMRMRDCLGCGDEFPSQHKFHRICDDCKSSEAWRTGTPAAHDGGYWLGRKAGAP